MGFCLASQEIRCSRHTKTGPAGTYDVPAGHVVYPEEKMKARGQERVSGPRCQIPEGMREPDRSGWKGPSAGRNNVWGWNCWGEDMGEGIPSYGSDRRRRRPPAASAAIPRGPLKKAAFRPPEGYTNRPVRRAYRRADGHAYMPPYEQEEKQRGRGRRARAGTTGGPVP